MGKFQEPEEEEREERSVRYRRTPEGRVYFHTKCDGETRVGGGDFAHICDPFWPCTSTYCCTCEGHVPLNKVRWVNTEERISDYRKRLRRETPVLVQIWRYGGGLLVGAGIGAAIGMLFPPPQNGKGSFVQLGAAIGAFVIYMLGTFLLNRLFDVDYRRMR